MTDDEKQFYANPPIEAVLRAVQLLHQTKEIEE
jgi:hypothetical protein